LFIKFSQLMKKLTAYRTRGRRQQSRTFPKFAFSPVSPMVYLSEVTFLHSNLQLVARAASTTKLQAKAIEVLIMAYFGSGSSYSTSSDDGTYSSDTGCYCRVEVYESVSVSSPSAPVSLGMLISSLDHCRHQSGHTSVFRGRVYFLGRQ
jgi:hypothetical protein